MLLSHTLPTWGVMKQIWWNNLLGGLAGDSVKAGQTDRWKNNVALAHP